VQLIRKSLLPPVFAKQPSSTKWQCFDGGETYHDVTIPDWITATCSFTGADHEQVQLRQFLESIGPLPGRKNPFRAHNTLYYLVVENVEDLDTPPQSGRQSAIQIYIGKAENGVLSRWREHCDATKKVLTAKRLCQKYGMKFADLCDLCKSYQLHNCFLALAWMRQFNMALFVVEEYKDGKELRVAEKVLILDHAAKDLHHGLNCRL